MLLDPYLLLLLLFYMLFHLLRVGANFYSLGSRVEFWAAHSRNACKPRVKGHLRFNTEAFYANYYTNAAKTI